MTFSLASPEETQQSIRTDNVFNNYTVYLDGAETATDITGTEYTFEDLTNGNYVAGVQAIYTTSVSIIETVYFNIIDDVGVIINNKDILNIYPSPIADVLNIVTESTITEIVLFDQNGKVVKSHHQTVDLQSLPTGHYIAKIHTATEITTAKIVKQ